MNGIGSVSGNSNLYGGYENYPKPFFPGEKEKPDIDLPGIKKEEDPGKIKIKGEGDGPGGECETCKRRKYKDGSDEMVSFKSPGHISPQASAATVRSHEQEHVSNAYKKAAQGDGKVINATVSLQTAVCPECGRSYVSGGTTRTQIKYYNEENPYQQALKTADRAKYEGLNLNLGV